MRAFAVYCAALLARFAVADHDLVFPIVAMGEEGADDDQFKDFKAQVMQVNDDVTTYSVGCATEPCAGWENLPDFTYTVAIGPSTFDFQYDDGGLMSTHSACTFTGSPATKASCEMTLKETIRTSDLGYEHHFTAPGDTSVWDLWNIVSATLKVVDGTVAPSATGASVTSGGRSEGGLMTPAPTAPATTGSTSDSSGGSSSVSSPQSTGAARIVRVGWPAVGMGLGVLGWFL